MKKLFLLCLLLILGSGLIFGGGQEEGKEAEKVKLTLWGWIFTGNDGTAIRAAVEDYQNENPNIELDLQDVNWAQAHDNLILMSQSGNMPDLPMINRNWLVEAVSLDVLENLTPRLEDSGMADMFYSPVRGDYKGKDYVLPYAGGNSALIINKTMFDEMGLTTPATFAEFVEICQTVTKTEKNFYGTAFCISEANVAGACVCNLVPILLSFGAKLVENNKSTFNSDEGVEAIRWMIDLEKKQKLSTPGSVTIDARKMREIMIAKNALMVFDGAWGAARYGGIEIDIVKMPKKKEIGTVVNIACWGLPKDGEKNDAAWEFLKYLYSDKYLVRAYQEAYHGQKDVQTALDDAAAKYNTILDEFYSK